MPGGAAILRRIFTNFNISMNLVKTKNFLKNFKKLLTFKKLCAIINTEDKTRQPERQKVINTTPGGAANLRRK